jgi:hypothetical protein
MKKLFVVAVAAIFTFTGVSPVHAESDPFPGVDHMGEIPGTRVSSPAGFTQSQWETSDTYLAYARAGCPAGSGSAISVDVSEKIWSNYCVKTWRSQSTLDAWQKYYSDEAAAKAAALEQSVAWNTANPGKQKCFPYGPLTSPDGGVTSGGVCANPVGTSSSTSETVTRTVERGTTETIERVEAAQFESTQTNVRVAAFLNSIEAIPNVTKRIQVSLPKMQKAKKMGLTVRSTSRTPDVCTVRDSRVRFVGSGECTVRIVIRDLAGNRLVSSLKVSRT